ncbi:MAG: Ig-like domain-containing protein [Actinomycetota bacterium]|nr:Ig-like domain-containing protein [Actinomycetota bacterium]
MPGSALAGTYTWDLASDFTATAPGANPDHDDYGGAPWSYLQGSTDTLTAATTFSPLGYFGASNVQGGLSAWSASPGGASGPLVGINATASPITNGKSTFAPGQVVVEPGSSRLVAIGWTSPFGQTMSVSLNGAVSADAGLTAPCTYATSWSVEQNGAVLLSGTTSTQFSTVASVPAGGSVYLTVSTPPADANCSATGVSLHVEAAGAAPPVTLATPVSGASSTVDNPTFSGDAGADFGDGSQVTLRVYRGSSPAGTPVETVTVPRSGASWSTLLPAPLPLGTYTAQAEQDDIASPADAGLSAPVTFTVTLPVITLDALGSRPLTTSTPTLTGTADSDSGSVPSTVVVIYQGDTTAGSPVARVTALVPASGQFSVQVTPALADGTYTAVALQADTAGAYGSSAPQTFGIDTQPPPVTLVRPGPGSQADFLQLVFAGTAGNDSFDAHVVTVNLYRGPAETATPFDTMQANVTGSTWSAPWPRALIPGLYTAVASQTDVVGHIGLSSAHTFRVLPFPPVIGGGATINRYGRVSVKIACNEPVGDTCSGTVVVLTRGKYQPRAGGPAGRLTVMFAYVQIPGAQAQTITRTVLPSVAVVLRRHANVAVSISANLRSIAGQAIHASARASLRRVRG